MIARTGYEGKKIALQIEKEWKTISKEKISNVGFLRMVCWKFILSLK